MKQMINEILDTDYTDYTVVFIYCNSVIPVSYTHLTLPTKA